MAEPTLYDLELVCDSIHAYFATLEYGEWGSFKGATLFVYPEAVPGDIRFHQVNEAFQKLAALGVIRENLLYGWRLNKLTKGEE